MAKDGIEVEGKVIAQYKGDIYLVEIGNGHLALAYRCDRMNKHRIKVLLGDTVILRLGEYDLSRGIIVRRL